MRVLFESADGIRSGKFEEIPDKDIGNVIFRAVFLPADFHMWEENELDEPRIYRREYRLAGFTFDDSGRIAIYREKMKVP